METSEWISIVLAIVALIIVVSYFELRFIRKTRQIQEKQYRLTLLNEIIDWAIDAKTVSLVASTPFELPATTRARKYENLNRILDKYKTSRSRSEYIRSIAHKFGKDLYLNTDAVVDKLNEIIESVTKYLNNDATGQILKECELALNEKASNLIIEATVIKNMELGLP